MSAVYWQNNEISKALAEKGKIKSTQIVPVSPITPGALNISIIKFHPKKSEIVVEFNLTGKKFSPSSSQNFVATARLDRAGNKDTESLHLKGGYFNADDFGMTLSEFDKVVSENLTLIRGEINEL